ncbi:MAG: hypothetical protein IKX91_04335 [Firmicutes bacterium]|nr:hypothetical protein [Bacillota bacterium]
MSAVISRFLIPIAFFIIFAAVSSATRASAKAKTRERIARENAARPAPLRTNVPKGDDGPKVSFDRDGQVIRPSQPSAGRAASYKSSSYVPTSKAKDSTKSAAQRVMAGSPSSIRNVDVLMEDRQNDWLAKQLREEARAAKRTSDMFELKMEHIEDCDARDLKETHARLHRLGRLDR